MKANTRIYGAVVYLKHGFTPWGIDIADPGAPSISLCDDEWIVCCGHTLSENEVAELLDARVLAEGRPDRFNRRTVVAGPQIDRWLGAAWDAIEIATGRDRMAEEAGPRMNPQQENSDG